MRINLLRTGASALVALFVSVGASAQDRAQEAMDLSRQGMAQYNNLEVEQARATLNRAVRAAQEAGVSGEPLARIYANLGVVLVGGLQDNASGMDAFENALREDPDLRLDPLTATPEISTVFTMAKRRMERGGSTPDAPDAPDSPPENTDPVPRTDIGELPLIPHEPILEQLEGTSLPVYVEVPPEAPVTDVTVFYRGEGGLGFQELSLDRMQGGFGSELPCTVVIQPQVQYYLVAYASGREPMGAAGSAEAPLSVPVVAARSIPAPALPGEDPPPEGLCGAEGEPISEEDPLLPANDLTCESDVECPIDYICETGVCQLVDDIDPDEVPETTFANTEEAPRFFVHVTGVWGLGFAGSGMAADSGPPASDPENIAWIPESGSPEAMAQDRFVNGETSCENNGDALSDYCVRLENAGLVPTFGLRLAVGYYVLPRLALALFARWQPNAGEGTLAGLLLGGRVQYEFTRPAPTGLHWSGFLGTSAGQIQPQPPQNGLAEEPFIRSGLNGIQIGSVVGYRFVKNLGVVIVPEVMFQFPEFLFNIDISAGLEVAF